MFEQITKRGVSGRGVSCAGIKTQCHDIAFMTRYPHEVTLGVRVIPVAQYTMQIDADKTTTVQHRTLESPQQHPSFGDVPGGRYARCHAIQPHHHLQLHVDPTVTTQIRVVRFECRFLEGIHAITVLRFHIEGNGSDRGV